jgi:lipocalin
MKVAIKNETEDVVEWRFQWLLAGGFTKRNSKLLANTPTVDWRYANKVLKACKAKGYDEDFVMNLIL